MRTTNDTFMTPSIMLNPYHNLVVLVVDDAVPILATIKVMLCKLGILERNIQTSKSARDALKHASTTAFDVVISDFNLGAGLNGKQLYEELTHYGYLKHDAVFMLISGDNSAATIRPIVELRPDEYILKPFTANDFKLRLTAAIKRKKALAPLYAADRTLDPQLGLTLCDEIQPFHKPYFFEIEQFRTSFLCQLAMHDEAKKIFESVLSQKETNWAKLGLANSLANLGEHDQADKIVCELLTTEPSNSNVRTQAANINLLNQQVPAAIAHLEIASKLTPGNSERELVIVNLCLSVEDYNQAMARYDVYMELNKNTFRSNIFHEINVVRVMLYRYCKDSSDKGLLNEIRQRLISFTLRKNKEITIELELLYAHYSIAQGNYKVAASILKKHSKSTEFNHFYTAYHYAWLLNFMEMEHEFSNAVHKCKNTLKVERSQLIFSSKVAMLNELVNCNTKKNAWLATQFEHCNTHIDDCPSELTLCLSIYNKHPLLKFINYRIIKLISVCWPSKLGGFQVMSIIENCDNIVRQLFTPKELIDMNYEASYLDALDTCRKRL